jgi:nicotinamidase-related amidase
MELVGADAAVAQAAALVQSFRRAGRPIVHVQHISKRPGATFFLPGTHGAEIHATVAPVKDEPVIVKNFPNSFRETNLLEVLRSAGADELVIAGMMTHMCVDSTVRAAADLGFKCLLAGDACATRDLQFGSERVGAREVQLSYLAALSGSFASIKPAHELVQ